MLAYDVISIFALLLVVTSGAPTSLYCFPGEEQVVLNGSVQCRPCQEGFYSGGKRCEKCSQCDRSQQEMNPCMPTHDRRCVCPTRKFFDEGKHTCSICKNCSKEEYQTRDCGYNRNRICARCPPGYRSGSVNARRCALRMTESPPASATTTAARQPSSIAVYVTGTLVAVFGTIILVFLACFWRRKRRHACQRRNEAHQLARKEEEFLDSPLVAPSDRPPRPHSYRQQDHLVPSAPHQVVSVDATLGVHLGRVNASVIQDLASKLNPQRAKLNWKALAAQLGFSTEEIANYELDPRSATQSMLTDWNTKHGSTVNKLYNVLQPLRPDAASLLEPYLAF